jgi:hypothetical protein
LPPRILGVDFTSAPRAAKPITVARAEFDGVALAVRAVDRLRDFPSFESLLREPGPWVGGFDFPFGLPGELVDALGWPTAWPALVLRFASLAREDIAEEFAKFRAGRPAGRKYATREADAFSGAHPSMKLVNPPVGWMLKEGAPRLLAAGVHLPTLHEGDRSRVALEAYPGLLVRMVARQAGASRPPSYKSDAAAGRTPARRDARARLVEALERGAHPLELRAALPREIRDAAVADATGDTLDAIACAVQAAWGAQRASDDYGLPRRARSFEGWIVSARRPP